LFYAPVYNAMVYFIEMFSHSLWWGIILITVIVRIILLWPQHKMMLSQRKLQKVQPKIKQIQEKYKGQQQVLWMKLMELYKKEKVNPMWSCGFLLIQMPILLVIYNVILYIKDESNLYYLYSILDWFDLSKLDSSFFSLELLESWWKAWIILAIVVWLIQYIQIKLSLSKNKKDNNWVVLEKKAKDDKYSNIMPDPEMMNKFMLYWMPAMVVVFTYMLFAWVWLYWWISTLFMIVQQLIVNNISKK
jgi:YidC/Oxa1 family membrane protein insertase